MKQAPTQTVALGQVRGGGHCIGVGPSVISEAMEISSDDP